MNKNELIAHIANYADISKAAAAKALDGVLHGITKSLKKGQEVRLVGFGTFCTADRKATEGRNPRTGEKIKIPAARLPKFRAGKGLKEEVAK